MYVFQQPKGRLINHITTGSLRMVLYTKELHLFKFEEWAEGGAKISNGGPSYRAVQPPRAIPCGLARLLSICHSETYQDIDYLSDYKEGAFGRSTGLLIDGPRLLARSVVLVDKQGIVRYIQVVPDITHLPDMDKAFTKAIELDSLP